VIIGRLYNDEDQPPENQEKEVFLKHSLEKGSSIKLDAQGVLTASSQDEETSVITVKDESITVVSDKSTVSLEGSSITIDNGKCKIIVEDSGVTIDAANNNVTVKSMGTVTIGGAATSQVKVGGRMLANAVADNDDIILSTHLHVGNLGAPCPVMMPFDKINSIQAKARNTQVG
jgi:hypothetical protein